MHLLRSPWTRLGGALLALILASCASENRPTRGEHAKPPPPSIGEATYFSGQLIATVRVGVEMQRTEDATGDRPRGDRPSGGRRGEGGGMRFGGSAGGGGGGGPGHFGGGEGGGRPGDMPGGAPDEAGRGRVAAAGGGRPFAIHVQVKNTTPSAVEVSATDFASPLGNFVVFPDKLTIPAGEMAEFTPMTAFISGDLPDEMPVNLTLAYAGKAQKIAIILRPQPEAATPPPPKQ